MDNFEPLILELASEDYTGLWEFLWSEGARYPSLDKAELFNQMHRAVKGLVESGQLTLYRGSTFTGEQKPVPLDDITSLIDQRSSWEAPRTGSEHLRVLTPDA